MGGNKIKLIKLMSLMQRKINAELKDGLFIWMVGRAWCGKITAYVHGIIKPCMSYNNNNYD
jgi:hypothetical protein